MFTYKCRQRFRIKEYIFSTFKNESKMELAKYCVNKTTVFSEELTSTKTKANKQHALWDTPLYF